MLDSEERKYKYLSITDCVHSASGEPVYVPISQNEVMVSWVYLSFTDKEGNFLALMRILHLQLSLSVKLYMRLKRDQMLMSFSTKTPSNTFPLPNNQNRARCACSVPFYGSCPTVCAPPFVCDLTNCSGRSTLNNQFFLSSIFPC